MAIDEAAIIPPITVTPIVLRATAPAPVANTNGNTPRIKASDVMSMGRKRIDTASIVDCKRSSPLSTRTLAYSTIKIAFLAARPIKVIRPIWAYTLSVRLGIKVSVRIAPKCANRDSQQNRQRNRPALVQGCEEQKDKCQGKQEDVHGL